jgi:hypothetical protein
MMFGWQYNEKLVKDYYYSHAKDFGRLYCELMLDSPTIYREFMKGFHDELERRTRGNDTTPTDKTGVSGG